MSFLLQNKNFTDIFFSLPFFILDMCWRYFGFIDYVGYLLARFYLGKFIIKKCKKQEPTVDKIQNIQMNLRQMTPPMAEEVMV